MKSRPDLLFVEAPLVPKVPVWARSRGLVLHDTEAAYLAGAALNSLDNLVRQEPVWAGVWRQRLALKSAAAASRLLGWKEDESALRDGLVFRAPGDDPGPAGKIFIVWRRLASRAFHIDDEALRHLADYLDIRWDEVLAGTIGNAQDLAGSPRPAPVVAAEIAAALYRERPDAELLAFWLADLLLAQKFRWPFPVPLLMGQVNSAIFKAGESRRRMRPGEKGWPAAVFLAYAQAAAEACDLGTDLAGRARHLMSVAPKLRAKGAEDVVKLLLNDDAVPGSWSSARLSPRGARRLFDRLQDFGAVRELTGRPTFRLYGL